MDYSARIITAECLAALWLAMEHRKSADPCCSLAFGKNIFDDKTGLEVLKYFTENAECLCSQWGAERPTLLFL